MRKSLHFYFWLPKTISGHRQLSNLTLARAFIYLQTCKLASEGEPITASRLRITFAIATVPTSGASDGFTVALATVALATVALAIVASLYCLMQ